MWGCSVGFAAPRPSVEILPADAGVLPTRCRPLDLPSGPMIVCPPCCCNASAHAHLRAPIPALVRCRAMSASVEEVLDRLSTRIPFRINSTDALVTDMDKAAAAIDRQRARKQDEKEPSSRKPELGPLRGADRQDLVLGPARRLRASHHPRPSGTRQRTGRTLATTEVLPGHGHRSQWPHGPHRRGPEPGIWLCPGGQSFAVGVIAARRGLKPLLRTSMVDVALEDLASRSLGESVGELVDAWNFVCSQTLGKPLVQLDEIPAIVLAEASGQLRPLRPAVRRECR